MMTPPTTTTKRNIDRHNQMSNYIFSSRRNTIQSRVRIHKCIAIRSTQSAITAVFSFIYLLISLLRERSPHSVGPTHVLIVISCQSNFVSDYYCHRCVCVVELERGGNG